MAFNVETRLVSERDKRVRGVHGEANYCSFTEKYISLLPPPVTSS